MEMHLIYNFCIYYVSTLMQIISMLALMAYFIRLVPVVFLYKSDR